MKPNDPPKVTERDIQRYNVRIGGLAALLLGIAAVQITNAQFGGGPPITYEPSGQIISTLMFACVFLPLAYYGTKWFIRPEDGWNTGEQT